MYSALPNARRSDLAPQPSTGYDPTHWQTGLLASNFTTRSAASIRRRRHLREELESSLREEQAIAAQGKLIAAKLQLITTQLEAHRKSDAIRRALRHEENLADNDALSSRSRSQANNAIPAWIEQQSQPTTTHVSADLPPTLACARDQPRTENETGPEHAEPKEEIAPATGQVLESTAHARTVGAASTQRTEEVSQRTPSHLPITSIDSHIPPPHSAVNSSFALPLVQSDLNSSFALPPTHSALLPVNDIFLKQSPVHHSVTFATHAAPTPTNAASVAERTAQTPTTSSTSKSPCDHARSRITKPMIETLWMIDSLPSPAPDYRANLNRYQPESKPTSTTSVMTSPYEAAKVPPPLGYLSRSTRGSSSNATAQSIHGVPTEFYHHHLSAEVSAQHSTMDKNNNTVWDLSKMQVPDGHEPRPRLFFDTND